MRAIALAALLSLPVPNLFGQAAFEVASVRTARIEPGPLQVSLTIASIRGGPGSADPGQIRAVNVTLKQLLVEAYGVSPYQVAGPPWLDSERYDIVAKVREGATKAEAREMWKSLLADRFGLKLHHESREMAAADLVVAKGEPKLTAAEESDPDAPPLGPHTGRRPETETLRPPLRDQNGLPVLEAPGMELRTAQGSDGPLSAVFYLVGRSQTLSALARFIESFEGRPVVDRTGLTGRYDFRMLLTDLSSMANNFPEGLGLKLVSNKETLDVLVVDHAEKTPTEN